MYSSLLVFSMVLAILPFNTCLIPCWCQKGPSNYQTLVNHEYTSFYTNCYLTGNNPSSNSCYDATCPGGNWVEGNTYWYDEIALVATDGDNCISQCLAIGGGYNIANMFSSCGDTINNYDDNLSENCNLQTCPNIWDGHCGAFNKRTDKWCDYDGPESNANICCAEDFSECCESDGAAIGGTIGGVVVFIIFCYWYYRRRRDNTNEEAPNCPYKFFCPPCAVFGYQGCESKSDVCMTLCFCWVFTLLCWEPKKVVVDNNNNPSIELSNPHQAIPISEAIELSNPHKAVPISEAIELSNPHKAVPISEENYKL